MKPKGDLGFAFVATSRGTVRISRAGREVATLRSRAAADFLAKAAGASHEKVQQLCARVTGNYRRGNESAAAAARLGRRHPGGSDR